MPFMDLRFGMCKWPIGNPGSEGFGFCGSPARDVVSPYCCEHSRIAYRTVAQAKREADTHREARALLAQAEAARGRKTA